MRVLIVDDEAPARRRLVRLLAAVPGLEVVGEAADGMTALQQVQHLVPQAIFLDVQMPQVDGLQVAASLPDPAPAIVFVTAHERHAVAAFDAGALDYVLKPVDPARLLRAVERLRERLSVARRTPLEAPPAQLLIADRGRTHVVRVDDITWLEAADNYVVVHAAGRALLMRRTLAGLLDDLGAGFVRTHRGAAVAVAQVVAVLPLDKGDAEVRLQGGGCAPCSRNHRSALMARLGERPPAHPAGPPVRPST